MFARRFPTPCLFFVLGLFLVVLGATGVDTRAEGAAQESASALDAKAQELEDLRYRIRASRRKAEALAQDEKQQMAHLAELDHQQQLTEELLASLATRSQQLRSRMQELEQGIESLHVRARSREASLAVRLREMYMRPRYSLVSAALGSSDLNRLGARLRALRHIASTERRLVSMVLSEQEELRQKQAELESRAAEVALHQSETRDEQARLATLRSDRARTLQEIQRRKRSYKKSAEELETAARALEELIARLEDQRKRQQQEHSSGFAALKGKLPWPVEGRVISRFGPSTHPQFHTQVVNKGWKIAAPQGTPIQALAEGKVDFVDWLPGYGQCIIVNHGEGYYSLYAHASTVFPRVGAHVAASEVIGEVGDTGSVEGSLLYLEVRQGRTPLDPAQWLRPGP